MFKCGEIKILSKLTIKLLNLLSLEVSGSIYSQLSPDIMKMYT